MKGSGCGAALRVSVALCAPVATVPSLKPTERGGSVSGQAGSQQPVQTVLNLSESIKGQNV